MKSQNWEELVEKDGVVKALENLKNVVEGGEEVGDDADDDCRRIKLVVVGDGAVGMCFPSLLSVASFPTPLFFFFCLHSLLIHFSKIDHSLFLFSFS